MVAIKPINANRRDYRLTYHGIPGMLHNSEDLMEIRKCRNPRVIAQKLRRKLQRYLSRC